MTTKNHIGLFDKSVEDAYEWLKEVEVAADLRDRHYALQALRGVLHALRDEVTPDLGAHFTAQLPLLLRGLYYEGFDPSRTPAMDTTAEAFIDRVRPNLTGYGHSVDMYRVVSGVLHALERRAERPMEKIKATLKPDLRRLWDYWEV